MKPRLALLLILLGVLFLVVRENMTSRPTRLSQLVSGRVEMCLACHTTEKLDTAHDAKVLGCSSCHLGDPLAFEKEKAHKGIVLNPGDLRHVEKTCGLEGCHAPDVKKVKNSLMATNRGILATLLFYWGEAETQHGDYSVEQLLTSGETSLAIDYYRKLCGTCHLWKQRRDLEGFFGEKGGGCTACHYTRPQKPAAVKPWETFLEFAGKKEKTHPFIVRKVPMENCIRCHNRSGRVGTSYIGVYEGENYGTPFEDGGLSSKKLPGDRYSLDLPADAHHVKGMTCIDCHTRDEIMGDGNRHAHYEQALEISCEICHRDGKPGKTRKDKDLNNIKEENGKFLLIGKLDDAKHPLNPPRQGTCDYKGHKRLTCESCHSTWIPQCYGCHVKRDMRDTHLDKLTMKETLGWWEEGRSYLRFETPMMAVWKDDIVLVTPGCQDIVTLIDEKGQAEKKFNSFTMAALNPHTTEKKGRSCEDCHTNPKAMGLGSGTVWTENGQWRFTGLDQGLATEAGATPPLDGYVDIDGRALQKSARPELRPFNKEELDRILRIGLCLPCHKNYDDPVYRDYNRERRCPVFDEESSKLKAQSSKLKAQSSKLKGTKLIFDTASK